MIKNGRIIVILCLITSVGRFVLDSYLPSLPAIAKYFHISDNYVQLTLTMYLLGFSVSQLVYGPLSDRFGRRKILIAGLSFFALNNFICTFAHDPDLLIVLRLFSGIGAGACGVLNRAIASDCFTGAKFTKAWSYTTTSLVLTLIFAPLLGGFLQQHYNWRFNFVVTTVFVTTVLLLIIKYLPETNHNRGHPLHPKLIWQNYKTILSNKKFFASTLCYTLAFAGLIVYFQTSPLLYMDVYEITPMQYGLSSVVIALSYLFGGQILRMLSHKVSIQKLVLLGNSLLLLGGTTMLIANLTGYNHLTETLITASIFVLGARIVIPNAVRGSLEEFRHMSGSTSALTGAIQMFGSFVISFIMAEVDYDSSLPIAICFIVLAIGSFIVSRHIQEKPASDESKLTPALEKNG